MRPGSVLCAFIVPLKGKLPDLHYQVTVPDGMADGPQKKLLETLSKVPGTAEYEIVGANAELTALSKRMEFFSPGDATFVFDEKSDLGLPT